MDIERFRDFFRTATGVDRPYPYQDHFANADELPEILNVPTGIGKTATAILGWLFRRRCHPKVDIRRKTPRRLVYCLPMRTLVEQTELSARQWLKNLGWEDADRDGLAVHVLMGGAEAVNWDHHPERDAILIGTQDMLLSRALNRGYGMSRYRWPVHFGLLSNDCLWVLDETQLMGVGFTTSVQLQGLRRRLRTYGVAHSIWMSATLDETRLATVDHPRPERGFATLSLGKDDLANSAVKRLLGAAKPLVRSSVRLTVDSEKEYAASVAAAVLEAHQPATLTLVVLNRVNRAQDTYRALEKQLAKRDDRAELMLIHSRFRPVDRRVRQQAALAVSELPATGRIIVSTQAIEAGVDISARTLFTELAPWASLVQRFGRCNRRGEWGGEQPDCTVVWFDIDVENDRAGPELAAPYQPDELQAAREYLKKLDDVGPASLAHVEHREPPAIVHTIRCKDVLELWDTTPDLSGNDLDVSRYIRDKDDNDVQFFWREFGEQPPADDEAFPGPSRDELCPVRVGAAADFVKKLKKQQAWRWDALERAWQPVEPVAIRPGMVLLLHVDAGGYDAMLGWTGDAKHKPVAHPPANPNDAEDLAAMDAEQEAAPLELTPHLVQVAATARQLKEDFASLGDDVPWDAIVTAARWHDVGKSHAAFVTAMRDAEPWAD